MLAALWIMAAVGAFALGSNDGANPTAAAVGAGLLRARSARWLAAVAGGAGAWLAGDRVATTLAQRLVPLHTLASQEAVPFAIAALSAASLWVLSASVLGLPVSTSHSLVGALAGVALKHGTVPLNLDLLGAIVGSWVWIPVGAAAAGAAVSLAGRVGLFRRMGPAAGPVIRLASVWIAFWWGGNDVANAVALAAQVGGAPWGAAIALGAACLALGAYLGSGRVLATMASGLGSVGVPEAVAVQGSVAVALALATLIGYPVSTTHAVVGALTGVLWIRRKGVNWGQVARVGAAWLLTAPGAGVIGWLLG